MFGFCFCFFLFFFIRPSKCVVPYVCTSFFFYLSSVVVYSFMWNRNKPTRFGIYNRKRTWWSHRHTISATFMFVVNFFLFLKIQIQRSGGTKKYAQNEMKNWNNISENWMRQILKTWFDIYLPHNRMPQRIYGSSIGYNLSFSLEMFKATSTFSTQKICLTQALIHTHKRRQQKRVKNTKRKLISFPFVFLLFFFSLSITHIKIVRMP